MARATGIGKTTINDAKGGKSKSLKAATAAKLQTAIDKLSTKEKAEIKRNEKTLAAASENQRKRLLREKPDVRRKLLKDSASEIKRLKKTQPDDQANRAFWYGLMDELYGDDYDDGDDDKFSEYEESDD